MEDVPEEKEDLVESVFSCERVRSAPFYIRLFVAMNEVWRRSRASQPPQLMTVSDVSSLQGLKGCILQERYFRKEADSFAQQQDDLMTRAGGRWSNLTHDERVLHDELDDKYQCALRKEKEAREKIDRYLETIIPEEKERRS